jgi:glycosyltransferase involved in cell wall biosynthesis
MNLLHLYPFYGGDLHGGAEVYEYHLAHELARGGAGVDVVTTCTKTPRHTSAFTSQWPTEYPPGSAREGAVGVHRFPVTVAMPALAGHAVARQVFRRWAAEDAAAPAGPELSLLRYREAMGRPRWYDALISAGRGPHSRGLLVDAWRRAAATDVLLAGFVPFATVWYAVRIARARRRPLVLLPFFHPEDRYHHFGVFYRSLAAADAVLAQTPYSAALFTRCGARRVLEVGVGIDRDEVAQAAGGGARFRAAHGLEDQHIALFVGRKEPGKQYALAVEAVERLGDDRVVLVMIGADVDGRPVASPRVRHLGRVSPQTLRDAYDACNVFVLPSLHESFGIVFLEAWARGKPVLGNRRCAPVASVIRDGVDGFLCGDAVEFAARIAQLRADPALAAAMGDAGRTKTLTRYTWNEIGRRVLELCRELCAARPAER